MLIFLIYILFYNSIQQEEKLHAAIVSDGQLLAPAVAVAAENGSDAPAPLVAVMGIDIDGTQRRVGTQQLKVLERDIASGQWVWKNPTLWEKQQIEAREMKKRREAYERVLLFTVCVN